MIHTIIMPDFGQTTTEGKVLRWLKSPGDGLGKGEILLEVETDKATVEVEAYTHGYLREVLVAEGEMAAAMSPIAILTDTPDEFYERPGEKSTAKVELASLSPAVAALPTGAVSAPGAIAAPAARNLAKELDIDLTVISGTGPGGLITRKDVERFAARRAAPSLMPAMAALTAKSKQTIPHFYVTVDMDVAAAEQWRTNWNAAHTELTASVNDVLVRVASKALRDVPSLNVRYHDGKAEPRTACDVVIVVAGEYALTLVPVPASDSLTWEEYLRSMRTTLEKAKQGRVVELASTGSPLLAVSNLGMFKVKQFSAIIPPTCTAILAVGGIRQEAVVRNKHVVIGQVCSMTLSADHRVVDGIVAAKFLERVQMHLDSL